MRRESIRYLRSYRESEGTVHDQLFKYRTLIIQPSALVPRHLDIGGVGEGVLTLPQQEMVVKPYSHCENYEDLSS